MKKTFKTFALMLLTAFAFSSCVDVPVPYNLPDKSSNSGKSGGATIEPQGEGTAASPFNVAAIVAKIREMEAGVESTEEYYIKGKVLNVKTDEATITRYGNHTFEMVDEGDNSTIFTAFQVYGPGKQKFTSVDDIKVGDEVVVCGKVVNFKGNTPETVGKGAAYVVSINSSGGGGGSTEGTEITCAEAVQLTNALADGGTSTETYTVTGYITEVVGSVSKNQQTFWMADTKDGGKVFEAYWANLPEGVSAFTKGMKVKITGQLMKYVNKSTGVVTPEIKNATVVILPDDGGNTPVEDGIPVTCAQAVELTNALADGGTSTETYTVTGYITEVVGSVSKNQQTFWMADTKDGGKVFEAYWADLPEGVSEFKVGMKVKITGNLMKYVNKSTGVVTPEIKNAAVVILEDNGGGQGGGQSGNIQHITIAEFLAKADANTTYELTGVVKNIVNTTYGNFDLVEGDASIFIYGLLDLEGNKKNFASLGIVEGDEVTLTGKYKLYNEKAEIVDAQFVSVKKGDGGQGGDQGGGDQGGGDPVTDLVNGDFESWVSDTEATGWKSACSASNAEVSKSTESRNGSFACKVAPSFDTKEPTKSINARLATQEMTLAAGSYTFSYYAKSTTTDVCQTRGGYVPVTDGNVGSYKYNSSYTNINNSDWTLVTYDFELTAETTLCLIVMNPKNSSYSVSQDILVDDATLVKK